MEVVGAASLETLSNFPEADAADVGVVQAHSPERLEPNQKEKLIFEHHEGVAQKVKQGRQVAEFREFEDGREAEMTLDIGLEGHDDIQLGLESYLG